MNPRARTGAGANRLGTAKDFCQKVLGSWLFVPFIIAGICNKVVPNIGPLHARARSGWAM